MSTQKLTQKSFVNGQYDRIAQNQEGTNGGIVSAGVAFSLNCLSSDKQEIRKRLGTKKLLDLDDYAVVVPYRYGDSDVALVLTNNKLDLYSYYDDILLPFVGSSDVQRFVLDWTSNNTDGYTVSDSNNSSEVYKVFKVGSLGYGVSGSTIGATTNGYSIDFEVPETVSLNKFSFEFRSGITYLNTKPKVGGYRGFRSALLYWSDDGATWELEPSKITQPDGSDGVKMSQTSASTGSHPTITTTNQYFIRFNIAPRSASSHKYWRVVFNEYSPASNADSSMSYYVSGQIWVQSLSQGASFDTDILVDDLKNIKYDQYQSKLKFVSDKSPVYAFSIENGVISFEEFKATDESLFTTYGSPTCVSYFQNRLWFSGFKANPALVLGSKFGDEKQFTKETTLAFDDYFNLTCNQLKSRITNIVGSQNVLYCFSEDGISFVDSGSNAMIASNQSIEFHLKNRMPAGSATPTFKDDVLLYASADGIKLYAVDYDMVIERFQVEDLAKYAKDITKGKIKELHYLNNESQLVYGLCEDNTMFALMFRKGVYSGFFPIDIQDGYVYDICPIKSGRDNKLLMVTSRSGRWFLEEKLDQGVYKDTNSVILSAEEKKWATYDNVEKNIAMDCYQKYDEMVSEPGILKDDVLIFNNDIDLSAYKGQTLSIEPGVGDSVLLAKIEDVSKLYCWSMEQDEESGLVFSKTDTPVSGDELFNRYGEKTGDKVDSYNSEGGFIRYHNPEYDAVLPSVSYKTGYRYAGSDVTHARIEKIVERGTVGGFVGFCPEFDSFEANFAAGTEIGVISQGRYLGEFIVPENRKIILPFLVNKISYGATYISRAILKVREPQETMKLVKQIGVSVVDSGHLEIGTSLDFMQSLEKIKDDSHYDLTNITMNGSYVIVPEDTPEWEKNIILQSKKGLPFTVNSIDAIINYSNTGGK